MERENRKQLITALIGVGILLLLIVIFKPQNYMRISDNSTAEKKSSSYKCPSFIICESKDDCGSFSLDAPIIYTIRDNPIKEYYAILHTFWVTKKEFQNMQCYDNEESAQVAGYQPSEQAKEGIAAFEWLSKSPEGLAL
jgi:hypothetical protein